MGSATPTGRSRPRRGGSSRSAPPDWHHRTTPRQHRRCICERRSGCRGYELDVKVKRFRFGVLRDGYLRAGVAVAIPLVNLDRDALGHRDVKAGDAEIPERTRDTAGYVERGGRDAHWHRVHGRRRALFDSKQRGWRQRPKATHGTAGRARLRHGIVRALRVPRALRILEPRDDFVNAGLLHGDAPIVRAVLIVHQPRSARRSKRSLQEVGR